MWISKFKREVGQLDCGQYDHNQGLLLGLRERTLIEHCFKRFTHLFNKHGQTRINSCEDFTELLVDLVWILDSILVEADASIYPTHRGVGQCSDQMAAPTLLAGKYIYKPNSLTLTF